MNHPHFQDHDPSRKNTNTRGSGKHKVELAETRDRQRPKRVSYDSLFLEGYHLWLRREFQKAFQVFEPLSRVTERGPRASIFMAHCAVSQQKFRDCSAILTQALPNQDFENAAAKLHDIFVFWKFTFYDDVRKGLEQFVDQFPDLPTPALLLAELYSRACKDKKAAKYFLLARERDYQNGAIGKIAKIRLASLTNKGIELEN